MSKFLFLSTLSLRRATHFDNFNLHCTEISIHALLAESDTRETTSIKPIFGISIHALLAESDHGTCIVFLSLLVFLSTLSLRRATLIWRYLTPKALKFLSTLSLRRATILSYSEVIAEINFYPRSPCGERRINRNIANS